MDKKKMHIILISNGKKEEYNTIGIYDKNTNIITYKESKELINNYSFDITNKILIKENIDYRIILKFKEKAITSGEILLKKEAKTLKLDLETIKIDIKINKINIKYKIIDSNEIIEYNVLIGE